MCSSHKTPFFASFEHPKRIQKLKFDRAELVLFFGSIFEKMNAMNHPHHRSPYRSLQSTDVQFSALPVVLRRSFGSRPLVAKRRFVDAEWALCATREWEMCATREWAMCATREWAMCATRAPCATPIIMWPGKRPR